MKQQPPFILFIQHGLNDRDQIFLQLARQLPIGAAVVCVPQLDRLHTWLHIEPLIDLVQHEAQTLLAEYPEVPIRVIGHSLGGLIWLELLNRQQAWQARVESLVLLAAPVAGAQLARGIDPFGWGIGIAHDLGRDRRSQAEALAKTIRLLSITGAADQIIHPDETRIGGVPFICLPTLSHTSIRDHWMTVQMIRRFWEKNLNTHATEQASILLRSIPELLPAHQRDLPRAKIAALLTDGGTMRVWTNPLGIRHVFLSDRENHLCFSGFAWPKNTTQLDQVIADINDQWGIDPDKPIH